MDSGSNPRKNDNLAGGQGLQEALKAANEMIAADPRNSNHYLNKGDICLRMDDTPGAVSSYLAAAWYLNRDGHLDEALAIYKMVLRYAPDNDEAIHASNRILMEVLSGSGKALSPENNPVRNDVFPQGANLSLGITPLSSCIERLRDFHPAGLKRFSDGEIVVREGDAGDSMYVIIKGEASVAGHFSGKEMKLASLSTGDLFGEVAFLTGRTRTADVIAIGDLEVYEIDRLLFDEVTEKEPELLEYINEVFRERVRQTIKKVRSR